MDRTIATRALIGAAIIGVFAQAWLFRTALGVNVVLLTAAVLATGWVIAGLAGRANRLDPLDAWLPIGALVVAGMIGLRSDPTLVFLDAATGATDGRTCRSSGDQAVRSRDHDPRNGRPWLDLRRDPSPVDRCATTR